MFSRPLCVLLLAAACLTACSNSERRLHLITTYNKVVVRDSGKGAQLLLSEPGLYEMVKEVTVSGNKVYVRENGQTWSYEVPEAGQYAVNLLDDTLVSMPARYGRAAMSGISLPPMHANNPILDSIRAKGDRARARQEKWESEERLRDGRSNTQLLLPGKMERISAHSGARLFVFTEPPQEVKGESPDDFEYYEINRYQYFLQRALQRLEEESDPVKRSEKMRREWEQQRYP